MLRLLIQLSRSDVGGDIRLLAEEIQYALSDSLRVNRTSTPENLHPKIKAPSFFLSSSTKTAKTITLHIQGLDNTHTRTLCEEALLKVKGVISFTFQTALKRCTVRVKSDLPTELLATAIATTKVLEAQQVIKNEGGKEIFIPLRAVNANLEDDSDLPAYLPEESPQEENEKAVLRTGTKSETSRSWIDAATNFLTKTFYW
ncbi:armadillo repeat-containing protein 1-like isoform X2 [Ornithorhynchus anatinus]|uniref:armadillo repeat-containing protein 1-like isoform X2 n=1 Tax=Ornithorhynchus anatinus TaxID=9258 RepID=UPI0004543248|nr:armadillo repeat-containing protein 1-like isoform X2 [Ornithorhynchus anatinus]